ncbi:MAG: hypothetical protein ACRC2B_03155 [Rubrivivax sp.]
MNTSLPRAALVLALAASAASCGTYRPQDIRAGQTEADVTQLLGKPTARYSGPEGKTRLEFATGPYGRTTWMVDLDAAGKATAWAQVLNETAFEYVQMNFQGMDRDWLRYTLGRPAEVRGGGWQGGWVWSWRYPTNECFWFQVSILDSGKLRDGGSYGTDPRCDPGSVGSWGR